MYHLPENTQQMNRKQMQGLNYLCKKPQSQRLQLTFLWAVKSSPARSWRCNGEVRGEGLRGEFTSCGRRQLPKSRQWDGIEPHGHRGTQENSPGLLEEGLLPPPTGTPTVLSWLRAAPAQLQEGLTQSSSAWDSTTELVPKKGKEVSFPPPGCQHSEMLLPWIPTDPNRNGQPLSYLDVTDFDSGVIS